MGLLTRRRIFHAELREPRAAEMIIGQPMVRGNRLTATIQFDATQWTVWFDGPEDFVPEASVVPFVTAFLLAAMRRAHRLVVPGALSASHLRDLRRIQEVVATWDPRYRPVDIIARSGARADASDERVQVRGTASFFSAGVDSCYTMAKHRREIAALVLVHGFDVPLSDSQLRAAVTNGVAAAAKSAEKLLIEVATNAREVLETVAPWTAMHGAVLAAVAHLLSGRYSTFFVPATFPYGSLRAHGSHPVIDPLWGNGRVALIHDGAERVRPGKAEFLVDHPEVLRWLRVCWRNTDGRYNCGRCVKCLNTLRAFRRVGALHLLESFPPRRWQALIPVEYWLRSAMSNEERNPAFGVRSAGVNDPDWASRAGVEISTDPGEAVR